MLHLVCCSMLNQQFKSNRPYKMISIESSIPILNQAGLLRRMESLNMTRRLAQSGSEPDQLLKTQARFVFYLWRCIGEEELSYQQFEEVLTIVMFGRSKEEIANGMTSLGMMGQNGDLNKMIEALTEAGYVPYSSSSGRADRHHNKENDSDYSNKFVQSNIGDKYTKKQSRSYQTFSYQQSKEEQQSETVSDSRGGKKHQNNVGINRQSALNHQSHIDSFSKLSAVPNHALNRLPTQLQDQNENESFGSFAFGQTQTNRHWSQQSNNVIHQRISVHPQPVISREQERELINRLYSVNHLRKREEMKILQDQYLKEKEAQGCTFRPNLGVKSKSRLKVVHYQSVKHIKGFDTAVNRVHEGHQKAKRLKDLLTYRNDCFDFPSNPKPRSLSTNPPKFNNRKETSKPVLFNMEVAVRKRKLCFSVRNGESAEEIAERLARMYSLNQDLISPLTEMIQGEMDAYESHLAMAE